MKSLKTDSKTSLTSSLSWGGPNRPLWSIWCQNCQRSRQIESGVSCVSIGQGQRGFCSTLPCLDAPQVRCGCLSPREVSRTYPAWPWSVPSHLWLSHAVYTCLWFRQECLSFSLCRIQVAWGVSWDKSWKGWLWQIWLHWLKWYCSGKFLSVVDRQLEYQHRRDNEWGCRQEWLWCDTPKGKSW